MNPTILNREFKHPTDGWYHIEPAGRHPNEAAGITQVIDAAAIESIVSAFNRDANGWREQHDVEFPGLLVDIEHFSHDADKETRAYGWLMELQNRADGIYGRINWTANGKAAVDGGDYRFFSTEYHLDDFETLSDTEKRPLKLAGLTLTNRPNNTGGRPITNRRETPATKDKSMSKIAEKLGLPPEATEDEILAAVTGLQDKVTALEDAAAKADDAVVNREVDALNISDPDEKAEITAIIKNSADRAKTLKVLKSRFAARPAAKPITNREQAKTPQVPAEGDKTKAARITNRAREIQKTTGCGWNTAYNRAKSEVE